ncbi:MAG: hypothetical protein ILO36_02800 [Abditibacteriota bacterium]|nr:hypothetical protein [Abditibacteriota bacterium]
MKRLVLFLFALFFCIPVFSADMQTPVTLRLNGERFYVICDALSKQTGYDIAAGREAADWTVYDRRGFISVDNVPLGVLLDTICEVFNFSYSVDGNTIILSQTQEQMKNEAELVVKQVVKEREEQATKKTRGVEQIKKYAADPSPENKTACPYGYILGTTSFGKAAASLTDDPILGPAVVGDNTSKFVYSELPEESQKRIKELAEAYKELDSETDLGLFKTPKRLIVVINRPAPDENNLIDTETVLSRVSVMLSPDENLSDLSHEELKEFASKTEIDLLYPENRFTNVVANALLDLRAGKDREAVAESMEAQLKFAVNDAEGKKPDMSKMTGEGFDKTVNLYSEFKKDRISFNEVLMVASVRSGVNIVADCFYRSSIDISNRSEHFSDVIMRLCITYGLDYDVKNNILTLKDKKWYMFRAGEIASDWLDYWEELAELQRGYSLEVLIEMAALTDLQIDYELSLSPQLNKQFDMNSRNRKRQDLINTREVRNKRDILRFLGSFSEEQRKEFFEAKQEALESLAKNDNSLQPGTPLLVGKISASSLSEEQWELFEKALMAQNVNYKKQKRASQVITMSRTIGDYVDYEIHMQPDLTGEGYTLVIRTNNIIKDDVYLKK